MTHRHLLHFVLALATTLLVASCGAKTEAEATEATADSTIVRTDATDTIPTHTLHCSGPGFQKSYLVANIADSAAIYKARVEPAKALVVISKREYRLYVYETGPDTTLAASFPVCYAINAAPKTREGDNCTPECSLKAPFHVSEIKDASTWVFDFSDGRGLIAAFGPWFIRLDLSQSFPDNPALAANRSIGIHGSTGNEHSIPGRDSHGCIRLHDADLALFHDNYVGLGTSVVVRGIHEGKYPFELKAERALGDKYQAARLTQETDTKLNFH